ncbi:COMM domain-containing protein 3 isoform X2 [Marmota monax]|uniref:COMM domain-containing protein 3 isoform X2 n=1 Tax=Marmota marmota marmota TaxID=9994 RepID=UPI0007622630|nr:COMM domain-containing protein 3 isoform X2 [Marmota marmota marmota]XP_027784370.1 COMM domain-containing protein 3 isoform X2 [Marmota flaviventris]XP_046278950.1 COMM domain-containing protein 3 isoform X2 [Marmota monax]
MELSESVQKGFQMLADPGSFDSNAFTLLLRAAFQSLLDAQADEAVLDHPDLKHIDPVVLKHCHAAAATYILEAGKHRADKSTLSIGRSLPHITDVSWRLEYQIKTSQLHKMYKPAYLVTLNVENTDSQSYPEISFSCSMEQLQDLVGKLKDASKSLERATQL